MASPQALAIRLRTGAAFMEAREPWLEELRGAPGAANRFAGDEVRLQLRLAHQMPADANSRSRGRTSLVFGRRANFRTHDQLLSIDCVEAGNELGFWIGLELSGTNASHEDFSCS